MVTVVSMDGRDIKEWDTMRLTFGGLSFSEGSVKVQIG